MTQNIGNDVNQVRINSLSKIQGQPDVIRLLQVSLESYFNARASAKPENMPSISPIGLFGPAGVGKSMVAKALHCELGNLNVIETNGELINNVAEISSILMTATDDTTIFIDEACMNMKTQNVLLTAISERKLFVPKGNNRKASYTIPLANFTLIMATNFEHQLCDALRNRIRIYCRFSYYSLEDLTMIIKQRADALGWRYESDDILKEIASRSKQTPRLALNRNLQMAYNVSLSHNHDRITANDLDESLHLLKIDEFGLDAVEREYLRCLLGGSSKLNVLSSKLGLPVTTISNVIEPFLLRENIVEKDCSQRILTEKGKKHITETQY